MSRGNDRNLSAFPMGLADPCHTPLRADCQDPFQLPDVRQAQSTRTAKFDPTSGSMSVPTSGPTKTPTRAPTRVPTRAPANVHFPRLQGLPTKVPTKRPTRVSTEVPTKASTKAVSFHMSCFHSSVRCPRWLGFRLFFPQNSIRQGASSLFGQGPESPKIVSCSRGALEQETILGLSGPRPRRLLAPCLIEFFGEKQEFGPCTRQSESQAEGISAPGKWGQPRRGSSSF